MRILEHYEVTLKGEDWEQTRPNVEFTIADDDGNISTVNIPDASKILEAFRWMSDNDCLRHLRNLEPSMTDNSYEIAVANAHNNMVIEHSYMSKTAYGSPLYNPINPHGTLTRPVPNYEYACTWTFYSKEHAVMFKLAMG